MAPHSSVLAKRILWTEEPGGLLSIGSHSHRVGHDWSDFACMHALEKEMETRSSLLAWGIPGMAEPGGLPSMGLHRVGNDWSDLAAAATHQTKIHIDIENGVLVTRGEKAVGEGKVDTENHLYSDRWKLNFWWGGCCSLYRSRNIMLSTCSM